MEPMRVSIFPSASIRLTSVHCMNDYSTKNYAPVVEVLNKDTSHLLLHERSNSV